MEQQIIDWKEFKKEMIEEITKNVMVKIRQQEKEKKVIIELFLNILDLKKELLK